MAVQLEGQPEPIRDAAIDALVRIKQKIVGTETEFSRSEMLRLSPDELLETVSRTLAVIVQKIEKNQRYIHALQHLQDKKATLLLMDALNRSSQFEEAL